MHIASIAFNREFSKRKRVSKAETRRKGNINERRVSGEMEQFDDPLSYSSNLARALFTLSPSQERR